MCELIVLCQVSVCFCHLNDFATVLMMVIVLTIICMKECGTVCIVNLLLILSLHCALAAAQCIVISPVRLFVAGCVCMWVCYHDKSKLCASILTKLGL